MGASRKLQGEIDRVLKKVHEGVDEFDTIWNKVHDTDNANLKEKFEGDLKKEIKKLQRHRDQIKTWQQSSEIKDKKALMDARKLIEREMERFKVFEKETKTKAFSKEGLGQQPKTDPREKAKSETRDWLNNVVGDLEIQIDNFEAELEGISVKKGKTRNPQLTHLETSIARHKAHVMKLELILRLLDNDELSPDEVNDIKEFLDEYVECNQVNFENYSNVDDLYATLPLDKVEALEDLVTLGTSGVVKAALLPSAQQNADQVGSDEILAQDSSSDATLVTSSPKSVATMPMVSSSVSPSASHVIMEEPNLVATSNASNLMPLNEPVLPAIHSSSAAVRGIPEESPVSTPSSILNSSNSVKEENDNSFSGSILSPTIVEIALERGTSSEIPNQETTGFPISLTSVNAISSNGGLVSAPVVSDMTKRNVSSMDERIEGGRITPPLSSPLSSRILVQQASNINDSTTSNDAHAVGEGSPIGRRVFSLGTSDWRPENATVFKNQNEGQIRGRPEIAPDQREKYLQRLQQVQQQGHSTLLSAPHLQSGNHKQFSLQQENSILQQFNAHSMQSQLGIGLNIQSSVLSSVATSQLPNPMHQLPSQNPLIPAEAKDVDICQPKCEDLQQQQQNLSIDMNGEPSTNSGLSKIISDNDLNSPLTVTDSPILTDGNQLSRDSDYLPRQPLQHSLSSASLGVIGRSVPDPRTIGDNLGGSAGNSGGLYDPIHNMQMLEAALYRLPQPKDSECVKSYTPRHPVATPASFPQTQADIVKNPAFWNRLGLDELGTDTLFFAFYHQQNTYQQYLAARELKRQSWRYHKQYSTWFQRHQEPDVTTDDYEKGTYVYFDFHNADSSPQPGWCQRIKTNFTFEYKYLEDDLVV